MAMWTRTRASALIDISSGISALGCLTVAKFIAAPPEVTLAAAG
jgi:hypothetical protein